MLHLALRKDEDVFVVNEETGEEIARVILTQTGTQTRLAFDSNVSKFKIYRGRIWRNMLDEMKMEITDI